MDSRKCRSPIYLFNASQLATGGAVQHAGQGKPQQLFYNGDLTTSTRTIPHLSCHNLNVSIKMYVRFDVARGLPC